MKRTAILLVIVLIALPLALTAGSIKRIEISPATLINYSEGHSGAFMGGTLTGDVYFARSIALRTTVGFTKDRYYPSELSYDEANYSFWLSMAPYAELNVAGRFKPYLAVLGSFGTYGGQETSTISGYQIGSFGLGRSPATTIQPVSNRQAMYSFGATVGGKFRVSGPVSVFAELNHFFYTNTPAQGAYYTGYPYLDQAYSLKKNPTYLSLGLSYELDLGKQK